MLDEAWSGLDDKARTGLDEAITERLREGGTIIFVNHYWENGTWNAARRYRLDAGRVVPVAAGAA